MANRGRFARRIGWYCRRLVQYAPFRKAECGQEASFALIVALTSRRRFYWNRPFNSQVEVLLVEARSEGVAMQATAMADKVSKKAAPRMHALTVEAGTRQRYAVRN
jgi:hypothetical protein